MQSPRFDHTDRHYQSTGRLKTLAPQTHVAEGGAGGIMNMVKESVNMWLNSPRDVSKSN